MRTQTLSIRRLVEDRAPKAKSLSRLSSPARAPRLPQLAGQVRIEKDVQRGFEVDRIEAAEYALERRDMRGARWKSERLEDGGGLCSAPFSDGQRIARALAPAGTGTVAKAANSAGAGSVTAGGVADWAAVA